MFEKWFYINSKTNESQRKENLCSMTVWLFSVRALVCKRSEEIYENNKHKFHGYGTMRKTAQQLSSPLAVVRVKRFWVDKIYMIFFLFCERIILKLTPQTQAPLAFIFDSWWMLRNKWKHVSLIRGVGGDWRNKDGKEKKTKSGNTENNLLAPAKEKDVHYCRCRFNGKTSTKMNCSAMELRESYEKERWRKRRKHKFAYRYLTDV